MPIAEALVTAKNQGIDVIVIIDKSQPKAHKSVYNYLLNEGIPLWIDYRVSIQHNKVLIIDGKKWLPARSILQLTRKKKMQKIRSLFIMWM